MLKRSILLFLEFLIHAETFSAQFQLNLKETVLHQELKSGGFFWCKSLRIKARGLLSRLPIFYQLLYTKKKQTREEAEIPISPSTTRHKARCVLSRSVTHFFLSGKIRLSGSYYLYCYYCLYPHIQYT